MQTAKPRAARGVTLIELAFVVALTALLATIVAPGLIGFVTSRRVEDVARRLNDAIAQGRIEAVKRNAPMLLCADASVTDGSCNAAPAAADWAKGWRLCFDADANGACDTGSTDDPNPVRLQASISQAVKLIGPASRIRFNPNGSVTASSFVDFETTAANATTARWLVKFAASGAFSVRKG